MNEAIHFAGFIGRLLDHANAADGGAQYRILVTDTAGNVSEIEWSPAHGQWIAEQGYDLPTLRVRLRLDENPRGDR
jgi:hypothetical protein